MGRVPPPYTDELVKFTAVDSSGPRDIKVHLALIQISSQDSKPLQQSLILNSPLFSGWGQTPHLRSSGEIATARGLVSSSKFIVSLDQNLLLWNPTAPTLAPFLGTIQTRLVLFHVAALKIFGDCKISSNSSPPGVNLPDSSQTHPLGMSMLDPDVLELGGQEWAWGASRSGFKSLFPHFPAVWLWPRELPPLEYFYNNSTHLVEFPVGLLSCIKSNLTRYFMIVLA